MKGWPIESDSFGVATDQIPEAMALARKLGVHLDFTKEGRAIFDNRAHQKQVLKAHGWTNKDDI